MSEFGLTFRLFENRRCCSQILDTGIKKGISCNITETSPYKVTPDFHLAYSKNGEIWGRNQNDKSENF